MHLTMKRKQIDLKLNELDWLIERSFKIPFLQSQKYASIIQTDDNSNKDLCDSHYGDVPARETG